MSKHTVVPAFPSFLIFIALNPFEKEPQVLAAYLLKHFPETQATLESVLDEKHAETNPKRDLSDIVYAPTDINILESRAEAQANKGAMVSTKVSMDHKSMF